MFKPTISKRALSILLSLSLILTSVHVPVSAEGDPGDSIIETTAISTTNDAAASLPQSSEETEEASETEEDSSTEESSSAYEETETAPEAEETESASETEASESVPETEEIEETEAPTEEVTEPSIEGTLPAEEPQEKVYEEVSGNISGDTVVFEGNIVISASTTIMAKKVIVRGDVIVEKNLTVNAGCVLEIDGDLKIQRRDENGKFVATNAIFYAYGYTLIYGNLYSQSTNPKNMVSGSDAIVELKGNLYQIGDSFFRRSNSGMILFSGDENQFVSFDRVDDNAKLGKIGLSEGKGSLKFATPFSAAYLTGDITLEGTNGDVSFQNLTTNGHQVTINGNLVSIGGNLSGKYHVTGDVIVQQSITLNPLNPSGELEIDGDLRIQKRDTNGNFTITNGDFFVSDGKVLVHGDLYSQSSNASNMRIGSNAVVELKGNLYQIGNTFFRSLWNSSGTILFSGAKEQIVSFDRAEWRYSELGKIVITNEQDKIIIATPVSGIYITHNVNLAAPEGGYVKLLNTQDNGKSVHIEGGFISYGNTITGHWEVDEDMLLSSSRSTELKDNGYLEVAGDLRLQQLGADGSYQSTSASIFITGNSRLIAGGGLVAQGESYLLRLYDQAVLEIKGNYQQIGNKTPISNSSVSPIVFSGSGTQTLSASGTSSVISLGNIVQSSNQSRLYATGNLFKINAAGDLNFASGCQLNTLSLNGHTAKFHGNATVGSLNLGGGRAECTGSLTITSSASVGNGLLTTAGDLIIASGSFSLGANGAAGVGGTLRYQSSSYTTINKGLVKVSGDIIHTGSGTLKFMGDAIPLLDGNHRHTLSYPVNSSGKSTRLFFDTLYANTGIGNITLPAAAYPVYDPETMDEPPQPLYPWNYFVPGDFGFSFGSAVTRHFGVSGVYAPTGNFSQSYTDMTVRTVIGEVSFSRTYNSLDESTDSRIGLGFSFSHFMKLSKKDNIIRITLPNGQVWNFEEKSSSAGTVYTAMDSRGKLSFESGAYVLKTLDNMTYIFRDGGIESITDQAGNVLSFTVSGGLIRSMSDASGCEVRFSYDGEGRLTGLSNTLTGESVSYTYSSGKLTEVKNAAGRTTRYAYGGEGGRLSSVTNHLGIVTDTITYVGSGGDKGKVLTHKDASGNTRSYDYGSSSGETIIRDSADANGTRRVEVQGYDTTKSITGAERYTETLVSGTWQESEHEREFVTYLLVNGENKYNEIQTKTDIYGNTTSYTRDSNGNVIKVSYPDGSSETSSYQSIGGNNCLVRKTERTGRTILYVYDEAGKLVLKEIDSLGGSTSYSESTNQDSFAVTTYEYSSGSIKGLVVKKTGALGEVSQYAYDSRGRLISSDEHGVHTAYTYDNRDHVITETVSGADIETVTTTYSYNAAGEEIRKIIASASGEQSVVRTVRDGLGRPIQEIGPAQYSASLDNISNDTYANASAGTRKVYNNAGYVISSTDPLGNVTGYSYDYYGNVLCETKANGSKTYTEYDSLNRVTAVSFYDHTTGATNLEKTVSYRKRGMYLGTITTLYFGNGVTSTTEEWSDFDGNTVRIQAADGGISTKAYSGGLLTKETSALGHSTTYVYSYGRLNTVTADFEDSSRYITKYSYDKAGNVTRIETSDNKVGASTTYTKTEYEYDAWSRLVTAKLFDGNEVTYQQYRYDSLGRTKAQFTGLFAPLSFNGDTATGEDADYSVTGFTYDYLGKVARTTDALGNVEIAQYDNAGNLVRLTDANGTVSVMSYDLLGRKVSEQITGSGTAINRSYTFDSIGCMTSVTENGETTSYSYNGKGLVTSESAGNITKEYSYDLQGKMLQSTIKDGGSLLQQTTRSYDQMGRLASVTDSEGHGASYSYDKDSRLIKTLYSNGTSETTSYNAAGHVKNLVNKDAAGNVISEYAYTYYVSGSPATKTDASGTTTYTYDGQNRLKTATYSDGTKDVYAFDDNGNRLTKTFTDGEGVITVTSYEYDKANRLIKSTEGEVATVYSYDNAGNLLTKTTGEKTVSHSYDLLGRLISYTDGETVASYDYYTSNMRRSKTVNGETTTHIWIGNDISVDMGANAASYLKGVRLVWSDYGYYLYNSHGDVVQLLDDNTAVIKTYDYDAFGIQKGEEPTAPDLNPYRYCGEYTDRESGYNYLRARYYDPTIGRFITADNHWNVGNMLYGDDPIKFGGIYVPLIAAMIQSGNLYVYCMNNPLLYVDSDGTFAVSKKTRITTGIRISVDMAIIDGSNEKATVIPSLIKRPYNGEPNSRFEAPNGDWRDYGEDGTPKQDYDHNDHGNPKNHPHDEKGGHYHDWKDGKRGPAHLSESNSLFDFGGMSGIAIGVGILFIGVGCIGGGGFNQFTQIEYAFK